MQYKPNFNIPIDALKEVAAAMKNDTPHDIEAAIDRYDTVTKPEPLVRFGVSYTRPEHKHFILDAEDAGYDIRLYRGRWYWVGPAVSLPEGDHGFETNVATQSDQLGRGTIIYPKISDSSLKEAKEERTEEHDEDE